MLFTALTGKFQELAADIPQSEDQSTVCYPEFKKRLLQAAGYTRNAAGLQLWDDSYDLLALCLLLSRSPDRNDLP